MFLTGYFYILLVAAVCGAVCSVAVWGGYEKYVKYIASLICVVLLISPFREFELGEIDEEVKAFITDEDNSQIGLYELASDLTEEKTENYISEIVFSKFGIKTVCTDIEIDWDKEEPTIENITVSLSGNDMSEAESVNAYLENILGGEVDVVEG